jgi:hypothetical protein
VSERRRSTAQAARFWLLARPVFRAVDWHASYSASARARRRGAAWTAHTERLTELDARRRALQAEMAALSATHGEACAECRGGCCTEERFRDSIVDRVLQDPTTPNLEPRALRKKARERHTEYAPLRTVAATAAAPADYCPNCTPTGCTLAADDRPVQCLAYHCRASIADLSPEECDTGIRTLTGLMKVMLETARLPLKG